MPVVGQRDPDQTRAALTEWLSRQMPDASDVRITDLVVPQSTGFSNETFLFDAEWTENGERTTARLSKTQVNLKLIPGVDDRLEICQLVAYNLTDIVVKGSWIGPRRLHLVPHVNAPVTDLPVRRVVGAHHFLVDLTLSYGRVLHDYNKS